MWLDKSNIETLYAPKKRNYKKELFEAIKKFAINSRVFVKSHVKFSLKAERNLMMK